MNESGTRSDQSYGVRLIGTGLVLALLGAGSIMAMVVGLSHLYVGKYPVGLVELAAFLIGIVVFFLSYGKYLDALERWDPAQQAGDGSEKPAAASRSAGAAPTSEASPIHTSEDSPAQEPTRSEPLPTSVIVAITVGVYGMLIGVGGLIWTRGSNLAMNLLASVAFIGAAVLVSWFGRKPATADADKPK